MHFMDFPEGPAKAFPYKGSSKSASNNSNPSISGILLALPQGISLGK